MFWSYLLEAQPMQMDHIHEYVNEILKHEKISHIRINMIRMVVLAVSVYGEKIAKS